LYHFPDTNARSYIVDYLIIYFKRGSHHRDNKSELKLALHEELRNAIQTHENILNYMVEKGIYHPNDLTAQLQITDTALNSAQQSYV
jgi:hypothetical protein